MDTNKNNDIYNELDDENQFEKPHRSRNSGQKHTSLAIQKFVQKQSDSRHAFSFTYQAARFEEGWLLESLGFFYEQQWISDVLAKVKIGKEASVYLCRSGEQVSAPLLAAKVYRPRMLRSLKNDHVYRQGRAVLDESGNPIVDLGMLKALHKRSVYGEQLQLQSWIAYEFLTLKTLHAAGADVPQPYEMGENAILMDYIGDVETPAPTLNGVNLIQSEVKKLYERVLENIGIMLTNDIIHGDLSAYNLLYWEGELKMIDFPQVISPSSHPFAWKIFNRDITRLCEYFTNQGLQTDPGGLASRLWQSHGFHPATQTQTDWLDGGDLRE
jgi:RIO kinase 1